MTHRTLTLDDDGTLSLDAWTIDDEGEEVAESSTPLGHVADPATSWKVPEGMEASFNALFIEWEDMVAFERDLRSQVDRDYWFAKGAL